MRLKGYVAIVTGGGSGIGRATSISFADEGAKVAIVDRDSHRALDTVDEISNRGGTALAVQADVSSGNEVSAMVAQVIDTYGQVDILVNNAGISVGDDILTFDESTWDLNLNVVLKSVYLCSKAALPHMIQRRTGAIVNVSSVNGLVGLGEEAYSAAKAGMISLTRNMAMTYGEFGVRVNCICPGTVRTPIWEEELKRDPQALERRARWCPLGRVGEPEDIAKAALFLASSDAAWITGSILTVDGGLTAGKYGMLRELRTHEE